AAALTLVAGQPTQAQNFAGKTITVIVGSSPGGGMDLQARTFSKIWAKNIPGQPDIIVKNIPGAGGMKAYNFVFTKAKPDGLTLIWGPWRPVGHVIGQTEVRFKPEDGHLLGAGGDYVASLMRTDVAPGIKSGKDVLSVKNRYAVSGSRADDVLSMMSRISLDLLGASGKYRYVLGYTGQGKQKVALMNNEVQFLTTGLPGYRGLYEGPVINKGIAVPVWYHPVILPNGQPEQKSSVYPNLKSFPQVYREVHGKDPSGPLWETYKWMLNVVVRTPFSSFAPPKTPKEIVDVLRAAHQKTARDPDIILPRMRKLGLSLKWATLPELEEIMTTYRTVKPEVAAELKRIVLAATKKKK
ncbi:MAG: hypothetical protein O3A84_14205, partial [Proteobacteria bacterium]|nr:hypothetical protein [Pseudomonadota bacterium]